MTICHICEREIAPGGLYVPGDPPRHLGCGQGRRLAKVYEFHRAAIEARIVEIDTRRIGHG